MRHRSEINRQLINPGIIAVVRVDQSDDVLPISKALVEGGVIAIEITLTIPGATSAIRNAIETLGETAVVGAGSVLTIEDAQRVIDAGAEFLVSPITRPELVSVAHDADRTILLGAWSPTEAQTAHEAGADFIKVFPADNLGPEYIKALLAPMPHLKLVPTGGVNLETAAAFRRAGCVALGAGSSLMPRAILDNRDWTALTEHARRFVNEASQAY